MRRVGCVLLALLLTASAAWAEGIPSLSDRARQKEWNEGARSTAAPSLAERARMSGQNEPLPAPSAWPEVTEDAGTVRWVSQTGGEDWPLWAGLQESSSDPDAIELKKVTMNHWRVTVDGEEQVLPEGLALHLAGGRNAPTGSFAVSAELSDGERRTGLNWAADAERSVVYADALAQPIVVEPLTAECFSQPLMALLEGALDEALPADRKGALHELFDVWPEMLRERACMKSDKERLRQALDDWQFEDDVEQKQYDSYEFRYGGRLKAVSAEAQVPDSIVETLNRALMKEQLGTASIRFVQAQRKLLGMDGEPMSGAPIQIDDISVRRTYGYLYDSPISTSDYPSTDEVVLKMTGTDGGRLEVGLYILRQTEETSIVDVDCSYVAADGSEQGKLRIWLSVDGVENPRIRGTIGIRNGDEEAFGSIEAGWETELFSYLKDINRPEPEAYGVIVLLGTETHGWSWSCFQSETEQRTQLGINWGVQESVAVDWESDLDTGMQNVSLTLNQGEHQMKLSADVQEEKPLRLSRTEWERLVSADGLPLWSVNAEQVARAGREVERVLGLRD